MNKNLRISIPEPCHENWNQMTPAEQGRFCGSCRKVVMDFTSMSDAQIIAYFKKASGNTCGRFYNDQLDREIQTPRKRLPWVKYFFQVAIPALFFSYRAAAQGRPVNIGDSIIVTSLKNVPAQSIPTEKQKVTGRVLDPAGAGVPFATVSVNSTSNAVQADANGNFTILIDRNQNLMVSAIGFISQNVEIGSKSTVTISMVRSEDVLYGDVVTVGLMVTPSEEKWPFFSSKGLDPYNWTWDRKYIIKGRVVNEEGEPLEAASVIIKESGRGAITDQAGQFELTAGTKKNYTVEVSSVGYQAVTLKKKGNDSDDIVLKKNEAELPEVVVTAPASTILRSRTLGGAYTATRITQTPSLWDRVFGEKKQAFVIYPNPVQASSDLKVEWKMEPGEYRWEILDIAGRSVKSGEVNISVKSQTFSISLPAAPPGTYVLRFFDRNGKSYSGKFIVRS